MAHRLPEELQKIDYRKLSATNAEYDEIKRLRKAEYFLNGICGQQYPLTGLFIISQLGLFDIDHVKFPPGPVRCSDDSVGLARTSYPAEINPSHVS